MGNCSAAGLAIRESEYQTEFKRQSVLVDTRRSSTASAGTFGYQRTKTDLTFFDDSTEKVDQKLIAASEDAQWKSFTLDLDTMQSLRPAPKCGVAEKLGQEHHKSKKPVVWSVHGIVPARVRAPRANLNVEALEEARSTLKTTPQPEAKPTPFRNTFPPTVGRKRFSCDGPVHLPPADTSATKTVSSCISSLRTSQSSKPTPTVVSSKNTTMVCGASGAGPATPVAPVPKTVKPKSKALVRLDTEASQLSHTLELTEGKLHDVYEDPAIQDPSTNPKAKKLNRTLIRVNKKLALINMKRYNLRHHA